MVDRTNLLRTFVREAIAHVKPSVAKKAACILIVSSDDRILAVSRRDDPTAFGMPGGKVDPGETSAQAAARELREETGLEATDLKPVFRMKDRDGYVTTTFVCNVDGDIDSDEEGVIRWVTADVLVDPSSCPFVDYNVAMFRALGLDSLLNSPIG